jgi:hypothetical protein
MIVAILLQCGAQAASIELQKHVNATNSLLTAASTSPFISEQAAESLLQYKNGSWCLSYQPGSYLINGRTLRRMWQQFDLLIVTYLMIGVLIQVPLVIPVMISPSLYLCGNVMFQFPQLELATARSPLKLQTASL